MKKQELVEVAHCDICGTDKHVYTDCLICHKDFCYDCEKTHTKGFHYIRGASNTKDICLSCLARPKKFLPLLQLLRAYEALRSETEQFYKEQEKRDRDLETQITQALEQFENRTS